MTSIQDKHMMLILRMCSKWDFIPNADHTISNFSNSHEEERNSNLEK